MSSFTDINKQTLHTGSTARPETLQLPTPVMMFKIHLPRAETHVRSVRQTSAEAHAGNVRMQPHTRPETSEQHREQTRRRPTPVAFFGEGPLIPPADSVWAEGPPAAAAAN